MNHAKNDPYVFIAIGKIFWVEKKQNKARKFLARAAELDKDNGDTWLHLLEFEKMYGDANNVAKVKVDFLKADPHHGEMWCKEFKKVANWRKDRFEILNSMRVVLPKY